jgi:hypothetical protein
MRVYVVEFMDYDEMRVCGVFTSMRRAKGYIEDQPPYLYGSAWRNRLEVIPFILNDKEY